MFLYGFIVICGLFVLSIVYSLIFNDYIPKKMVLFKNGTIIAHAPLSPLQAPPLGTDQRGYSLAIMLLIGAKYTLAISFIITGIRLLLATFLGWIYGTHLYRYRKYISELIDSFHFVPFTLLAAVILMPVLLPNTLTEVFKYSVLERELFEIVVLALLAVPIVSLQIGNFFAEISQKEFIISAKILGASHWRIFIKEIFPHLLPRVILIFIQQLIQVMIVLAHLGILGLYFGGTIVLASGMERYSTTNEWSGLIGLNFDQYLTSSIWLFFSPIIMYTIALICFNLMNEGLKQELADMSYQGRPDLSRNFFKESAGKPSDKINWDGFTFLNPEQMLSDDKDV